MLNAVILSGGSGSRLWPVSREALPKPFACTQDQRSLFTATLERFARAFPKHPCHVVCQEAHRFFVAHELQRAGRLSDARILLEPMARSTAPAVALAALQARQEDPDAVLAVMPSDHLITDEARFTHALDVAQKAAFDNQLITFGVVPQSPHTGYGYIQPRATVNAEGERLSISPVSAFVEKPDAATAERLFSSGDYLWNSGIFVFLAERYLQALADFAPEVHDAVHRAFEGRSRDMDFIRPDAAAFERSPSVSVDHAVMEKTQEAAVVPVDMNWHDVGTWSSLWAASERDAEGNVVKGDVYTDGVTNSHIEAHSRLVAAIGVNDCVLVETEDAVLVADKAQAEKVKSLVERLSTEGRPEAQQHHQVFRPWGSYKGIAESDRFQVKRIWVEPGQKLSLQKHHHRAEHWVIVRGTAQVTRGDEQFLISEDQSTYIPIGEIHCLENPGLIPLEMIEVQTGSYLGEDDIVRLSDNYGRGPEEPASPAHEATSREPSS